MEKTEFILQTGDFRAAFDPVTGALTSFVNTHTGWAMQRRAELGLSFEMLVPLPERRNNKVLGQQQRVSRVACSADGNTLTFVWDTLESELGGTLDITFTGTVTLSDEGLTFAGEVQNRSPYTVEDVVYPMLGDVTQPGKDEPLYRWTSGYSGYDKVGLMPVFNGDRGYFGTDYPMLVANWPYLLFMLMASEQQGLYVGCHDLTQQELVNYTFVVKPGLLDATWSVSGKGTIPPMDEISGQPVHLELHCVHMSYVDPGATCALSPVVLQPYVGSWHAGVDHYKAWRRTWYTPPTCADWAQDVHSWQQLQMNSPEDELRFPFSGLVQYAEECARHDVKAIQLVGWNHGGQDRGNPDHTPDPRLGGWEALQQAIAECEKLGVKIILFTKFIWADRSQDWYRNELVQYTMKDPYGDPYYHQGYQYQTMSQWLDISPRRFAPTCMLSEEWRHIAFREFTKGIELGAAGMLFDECCHHGNALFCFDPHHGHAVPGLAFRGDTYLEQGFREISDRLKPDYLFAGEANYDLQMRHYNISYGRLFDNPCVWARYIDPWMGIMMAVTGYDDRININRCLQYRYIISYEPLNFKGSIEDFPLTLEYGKKVDALRRRYRAYLWDGEFRDVLGASVTADGEPYTHYTVYTQPETGKRAVVVVNEDAEKTLNIAVTLDGDTVPLVQVTPKHPEPQATDGAVTLPPRSTVVVMEI